MADIAQLERALINADAAGDTDAARMLASEIARVRGSSERAGMVRSELMRPVRDAGNALAGLVRGAGSIGASLMAPQDYLEDLIQKTIGGQSQNRNTQRRQDMTGALQTMGADPQSIPFQGAKLLAEIGGTAGAGPAVGGLLGATGKAPALAEAIATSGMKAGGLSGVQGMLARMLGGGVSGGAAAGMIDPTEAGTGAVVGAALPPALAAAGKAGGAIGSALRPSVADPVLAEKAINQYGIPLGASDISASGMAKGARSALDDSWLVGGIGRKRKDAVQEAFNKAIGETFGAPAPKLTPNVVDAAKQRLGSEFDRIWGGNTLKIDGGFVQDLQRIQADAATKLNPEQAAQVQRQVQNLLQKANGLDIDGSFANNWQSELRMVADGEKGLHQKLLNDLRKATISAFNRSISPADAKALTLTREQYKAFKTVEPLLQKGEAGTAGRTVGDIPASLLPEAVRSSYGSNIAGSPFADLTQIGSQFIADRVPRTGGSARAAVQNLAVGGGLVANPALTGVGVGGLFGLEALLSSPSVAKAMLPSQRRILQQLELERLLSLSAPAIAADQ